MRFGQRTATQIIECVAKNDTGHLTLLMSYCRVRLASVLINYLWSAGQTSQAHTWTETGMEILDLTKNASFQMSLAWNTSVGSTAFKWHPSEAPPLLS